MYFGQNKGEISRYQVVKGGGGTHVAINFQQNMFVSSVGTRLWLVVTL